jgi:hypothetical protein
MLWYSGFLDYDDELVKTYDEKTFLDGCTQISGERQVNNRY